MSKEKIQEYLKELIGIAEKEITTAERELVNWTIQEWIYQQEFAKPVHTTKLKAQEGLSTSQRNIKEMEKRMKYLEENIAVYKLYAKEHGFNI